MLPISPPQLFLSARRWLVAVALSSILPAASLADDGMREIPLSPLPSGHVTLDVMLNGEGPFPFVIDTAASHTAVIEPVASQFGYQAALSELADVQTLTEAIVSERFLFDSVSFPGVHSADINAVVVGAPMGRALPVLGLLGSDVMEGQSIQIDYVAQVLRLNHPGPEHRDGQVDAVYNVLIGQGNLGRARQPVRVLVDTGSARTIVNNHFARWTRRRNTSLRVRVGGASRLTDTVDTEGWAEVQNFRVGGLCLPTFLALEANVDIFRALGWQNEPAVVLGMDVLQHTVLTIDHAKDEFELSPAGRFASCASRRRVQVPTES